MRNTVAVAPATEEVLPARVQEALGELVGCAREGLLALCVGVGPGVVCELIEEEVTQIVGPRGRHDPDREAVRHGRDAGELMSRSLADVRLAVMMLDGIDLDERTHVVALGITTEGVKIPLGLWEGSSENATVARHLLADLVARGLDPEQGILFVIDGAKALRKAIRDVFGDAPVQRCARHKERNCCEHLPEPDRPNLRQRLRSAWADTDHDRAHEKLRGIAVELDRTYPDAARSLREGLEETLTLTRLGVHERLRRTLQSTNPCESMVEIVRRVQRNVKRWREGDMALRWTAAGMLEAERKFRRIVGYSHLATLVQAIEREHAASTAKKEAATLVNA